MIESSSESTGRYSNTSEPQATSDYRDDNEQPVLSALFVDANAASTAIRELREIGVGPEEISVISRDRSGVADAGVSQEEAPEEGSTYRASMELPNDEDLLTTEAAMTGSDAGDVSEGRIGLSRDSDMVRRNEAETNADEDIYSDFPDQPGGVNPDSPIAENAGSDIQEASPERTGAAGNAATGAGIGGVVGLLAGLVGLAIPGVGPFLAAGPLAGVLSGLLAGGAAGGIIGALSGIGVPEDYAREYATAIEQGHTLISVRTNGLNDDSVERVLIANGGDALH